MYRMWFSRLVCHACRACLATCYTAPYLVQSAWVILMHKYSAFVQKKKQQKSHFFTLMKSKRK